MQLMDVSFTVIKVASCVKYPGSKITKCPCSALPLTNTDAVNSEEPNTFSPRHMYFPSSDLEAFRIRRLPSGRTVILKIIKKVFILK